MHSPRLRAALRLCTTALAAATAVMLGACDEPLTGVGGRQPPFLAVVVFVDAPPESTTRGPFNFRIRELSGELPLDTTISASVTDTIILPVPAASYRVDISDVPATCAVRNGTARAIVVPPNSNTSLIRYFITCAPGLVVITGTDGAASDPDYVLTVTDSTGPRFSTVMTSNDTVRVVDLAPGAYEVTLRLIADNCVVTSDGGERRAVEVDTRGNQVVNFRVVCANEEQRPDIIQLAGSYADGEVAYVIRATDPDGDIVRSFVDVTDCERRSILPQGGQRRGGFGGSPNVARRDTAVIIGAYDFAVPDTLLAGRCLAAWVDDGLGNVSRFIEVPLAARDSMRAPIATSFNARLKGVQSVLVDATISDPDNNPLGAFVVYLVRDGVVIRPANGQPDRLLAQPAGIIGPVSTELPVGIGFGLWNDYVGVVLYAVDAEGQFTRYLDLNLFQ